MDATDQRAETTTRRSFSELVGDSYLEQVHINRSPAPTARLLLCAYGGRAHATHRQVTFLDVIAYELTRGSPETVIFDIEAVPTAEFVAKYQSQFQAGRNYTWPLALLPGQAVEEALRAASFVAFELQSTTGTDGWFLANQMIIEELSAGNEPALLARYPL